MCMCVNDNEVLACEEEEGTIILQASCHLHLINIFVIHTIFGEGRGGKGRREEGR